MEFASVFSNLLSAPVLFFALGLLYQLFDRPVDPSRQWIGKKFGKVPAIAEANLRALDGRVRPRSLQGAVRRVAGEETGRRLPHHQGQ